MTEHHSSRNHHDHSGHDHGAGHEHAHGSSERRLLVAAVLTGVFMLAEVAGGLISGSLALLADAGHMAVDFAALALALLAFRIARRPADRRRTYGYGRFQVLVAFTNGLVLFAVAGWIAVEAVQRLREPVAILGGPMLLVAVGGLLVNVAAFLVLHGGDREDLNLRGAFLHVAGDLLGSLAAILASLVILWSGWTPIDPILSVLVSALILGNAWRLVRDSAHILLEGAPAGLDPARVAPHVAAAVPGVLEVHHLHLWAISPKRRAATLHARIADEADPIATTRAIKAELETAFAIGHATVEIEHGVCADAAAADCGGAAPDGPEDSAAAHRGHAHAPYAHGGEAHGHRRGSAPPFLAAPSAPHPEPA